MIFLETGVIGFTVNFDRSIQKEHRFIEVFVGAVIDRCMQSALKGVYIKAHGREINSFTGIDTPSEKPEVPLRVISSKLKDICDDLSRLFLVVFCHQLDLFNKYSKLAENMIKKLSSKIVLIKLF